MESDISDLPDAVGPTIITAFVLLTFFTLIKNYYFE